MANNNKDNLNVKSQLSVRLSISLALSLTTIYGSTAAVMTMNAFAQTQTLPKCTDPTGHNLPCMMVISTLPAPANAVQCQEPTGQILPCSYATQALSGGQQVVVITVYVQPNFIFTGGPISVVKEVIVHEKIIREGGGGPKPPAGPTCKGIQGVHGCIIFMPGNPPTPIYLTPLPLWCHTKGCEQGWFDGNTGSDAYNPFPPGSKDWADYNHALTLGFKASKPYTNCEHWDVCPDPKYDPTNDTHYKPQQQPSPCLLGGVDTCSQVFASKSLQSTCPPIGVASLQCGTGVAMPGQVTQQQHTAAYLQALNSGSPNPYKPGTKDYEHYQAGLTARQQNNGIVPSTVTSGGKGNNNNPSTTTKKCPDGSTVPAVDKCLTTSAGPSKPLSLSTGTSSPGGPSNPIGGSPPPPSGGTSSGSGESSGGGSSGNSGSTGSSGSSGSSSSGGSSSSSTSGSNSDSGPHHH